MTKKTPAVVDSSKIINAVSKKVEMERVKSKMTKQRRSLSPVQEDTHVESIVSTSNNNLENQPTTYTISSQQSTDFEMIDEGALPILTEGAEESMIARDEFNLSTENVSLGDDVVKSSVSDVGSPAVSMVVDNEADQIPEELSTPERPPSPLLEEQLPIAYCKYKSEESIDNTLGDSDGNSLSVRVEIDSNTEIDIPGDKTSNSSVSLYEESILSTPERPPGPFLEERDNNINALPINTASISEQSNAPELSINLNDVSVPDTDEWNSPHGSRAPFKGGCGVQSAFNFNFNFYFQIQVAI